MRSTRLVLLLAVLGCTAAPDDGELAVEDSATAENGDSKGDSDDLPFTDLDDGLDPGADFTRRVFTSAEGYEAFFGRAAPPDVDWSRDWVVLFNAGFKPTGGYSAHVRRITTSLTGKTLKVTTSLESPGPDCVVTQAFTTPFIAVRFPRPASSPTRVRFFQDDVVVSCAATP